MPELPEVETIRRGIEPLILRQEIVRVVIRTAKLRWPIPTDLERRLAGQETVSVERRGKYLLLRFSVGTLLIHFGMSGYLRVIEEPSDAGPHDHFDIRFSSGTCLRFNDARRFGALLWIEGEPSLHPLLADLGPEPFSEDVNGDYLFQRSRNRRIAVKPFIMDHRIVAGIGNMYASEALFRAGIHPALPAGQVSRDLYDRLAYSIRQVLTEALSAGDKTLGGFGKTTGRPGYFSLQFKVYGRAGEPCEVCGNPIVNIRLGQRSSFFCPVCQK
ncbi:MAG: bifunctional DNA-formamidopyrimidine glycosylase/DNA-(apurinic or apyrimidinic site) lyase [Geobacteraceae bacterium]|nr:bifunctional DNA-formamidopyrimidine glycosylase/DNA-(apurinic or apyrimidinic site) lyase [Geobacteraceae bacterium]